MDTQTLSNNHDAQILNLQPGQLRVINRHGQVSAYNEDRVATVLKRAFFAVEGENAPKSSRIHAIVSDLTKQVTTMLNERWPTGGVVHLENIQDLAEITLMRAEEREVASAFILYRAERRKAREQVEQATTVTDEKIRVTFE